MRLVICVDRDDDLGRKAGIRGPVLGREAVLDAAMKLGVADPEDSDTNAMLAAVNLLDELRAGGEAVEALVLTGDGRVGTISDRKVAQQLDEVLSKIKVEAVHLVSDGAEDEYLYPIIQSRTKVDSVRKVYVRQSATLQGFYYTLTRALKDQKLRTKTVLPLASFFVFLGIVLALQVFYGVQIWGYGLMLLFFLFGFYLFLWIFEVDEWLVDQAQAFGSDLRRGSVAVFFGILSTALVLLGFLLGERNIPAGGAPSPLAAALAFLQVALLWWIGAAACWEGGRALRWLLSRNRVPPSVWVALVSFTAAGIEGYSLISLFQILLGLGGSSSDLVIYLVGVALGIVTGGLAETLRQYLRTSAAASSLAKPSPTSAN
jgi:putative membrane protein